MIPMLQISKSTGMFDRSSGSHMPAVQFRCVVPGNLRTALDELIDDLGGTEIHLFVTTHKVTTASVLKSGSRVAVAVVNTIVALYPTTVTDTH